MSRLKTDPKVVRAARMLRGKTIKSVALEPFDPNGPEGQEYDTMATDPVITFTDGTCLRFVVQETEVGEYGITIIYPTRTR